MKINKLIKSLSLGIISLSLLISIGMVSSNNNIHAMSKLDQEQLAVVDKTVAKDDRISDAIQEADETKMDKISPSDRISDEYEEENWGDNRFSKIAPAVFSGSYVKGSKADQKKDAYFINKYMKHETQPINTNTPKSHKHVNRHRNKRAKRTSRKYKKVHNNYHHKRSSKSKRLTKKQLNHINYLIKKNNRALRTKKAKHNYNYRKALLKKNKSLKKLIKSRK